MNSGALERQVVPAPHYVILVTNPVTSHERGKDHTDYDKLNLSVVICDTDTPTVNQVKVITVKLQSDD